MRPERHAAARRVQGQPRREAAVRDDRLDLDRPPGGGWRAHEDAADVAREPARTAAVGATGAPFDENEAPHVSQELARGRKPGFSRRPPRYQLLVFLERDVVRRTVEDAHPELTEAARLRRAPDVVDVDVALHDT